jgi:hypothetical protein
MNELHTIQSTLEIVARRRRWQRAMDGLLRGMFAGGCLWLAVLVFYKVLPIPGWTLTAAGILATMAAVIGLVSGAWHSPTLPETARWIDVRLNLKERLSTALEMAGHRKQGEWSHLVLSDAAAHVSEVHPSQLQPYRLSPVCRWVLVVFALSAGLGFVPEYRSASFRQSVNERQVIRDTGRQLTTLARVNLEQRKPTLTNTTQALEKVSALGEQLTFKPVTRNEALHDLAALTDKLKEQLNQLGADPGVRRLEAASRAAASQSPQSSPASLQKQMDALKQSLGEKAAANPEAVEKMKRDLDKLQAAAKALAQAGANASDADRQQMSQALTALSQQAGALGLNMPDLDQAIAALAAQQTDRFLQDLQSAMTDMDKLAAQARSLQQLQAQAEKTGKDLPEQLAAGQAPAAQQSLQKMIDQLKSGGLSKEQLEKMLDEVSKSVDPAQPYGKVADELKKACDQMKQGDKSGAAQSLAQASKELDDLMQQMGDAQSLKDAMDALKEASFCIGSGQKWGLGRCPGCGGKGCGQCRGTGGKGGGSGVGTWGDDSQTWDGINTELVDNSDLVRPDMDARGTSDRGEGTLNEALKPTKVKGQFSPGAPMPSITLKGVSIKGQSKIQYEEAMTAAQSDAEAALNQDKVPKAYQNAVRDYFDDIKK